MEWAAVQSAGVSFDLHTVSLWHKSHSAMYEDTIIILVITNLIFSKYPPTSVKDASCKMDMDN